MHPEERVHRRWQYYRLRLMHNSEYAPPIPCLLSPASTVQSPPEICFRYAPAASSGTVLPGIENLLRHSSFLLRLHSGLYAPAHKPGGFSSVVHLWQGVYALKEPYHQNIST